MKKKIFKKLPPKEAKAFIEKYPEAIILDVRTHQEYLSGHIPNAKLFPLGELKNGTPSGFPSKDSTLLVYCHLGYRSAEAAAILKDRGFETIYDIGGIADWPYEITK